MLWSARSTDPLLSVRDGVSFQLAAKWWLEALIVIEALRQVHFLISEHVAGYHRFWPTGVYGRFESPYQGLEPLPDGAGPAGAFHPGGHRHHRRCNAARVTPAGILRAPRTAL
ncbi:MAG: hypothetical protein M3256_03995, partial [Actinomycetota bacterium]|nr:hypothetical protein [Actinomycetota bacterium]